MEQITENKNFSSDRIPFFIYGILITAFLLLSWMKWGDLVVDTGRELVVPAKLLGGKMLYRDVPYFYGPLAPYLNSLFYLIGGVKIASLVTSGLFSLFLIICGLHELAGLVVEKLTAAIIVTTFICVFAFGYYYPGQGNFNFIIPYSYASSYGMTFAILGIYFFYRKFEGRGRNSIIASVFIAMTLLTRFEIGFSALAAMIVSAITAIAVDKHRNVKSIYPLLIVLGVSIGVSTFIYATFLFFSGNYETGLSKAFTSNLTLSQGFFGQLSGLNDPLNNFFQVLIICCKYAIFAFLFAIAGMVATFMSRPVSLPKARILQTAIALLTAAVTYFLFSLIFRQFLDQYRCLPLLCLFTAGNAVWNMVKGRDPRGQSVILAVSLFSFFALFRMILKVWAGHYGFYLAVPGLIVYYFFFLQYLPSRFNDAKVRLFTKGGFAFLSFLFVLSHFNLGSFDYALRTVPVVSPRGTLLFLSDERTWRCQELLEYLQQNTSSWDTLAVFPEGAAINYLSDRENPLYNYSYLPLDLSAPEAITNVIDQLEHFKVTYVVVLQRETAEYGFSVFGKDYASEIMEDIDKNYFLAHQFGPPPFTSPHYGISLFKRKTGAPS